MDTKTSSVTDIPGTLSSKQQALRPTPLALSHAKAVRRRCLALGLALACLLGHDAALAANQAVNSVSSAQETHAAQSLLWFDGNSPKALTSELLSWAEDLGSISSPSPSPEIRPGFGAAATAELDASYTRLFLALLNSVARERGLDASLTPQALRLKANQGQLSSFIRQMLPQRGEVTRLRQMIRRYRGMTRYVWPSLEQLEFKLGQRSPQIAKLRWMLRQLGDLAAAEADAYREAVYDPTLASAIKHFQLRHGLAINGELDGATLQALNTPPAARISQMQANLWRWLELPALPGDYLWINLPAFRLDVIDSAVEVMSMKVIVGKSSTPTPQFATHLTRFTLNPTWTPPASIIYGELIPKNSREPGYLSSQGFELRKPRAYEAQVLQLADMSASQIAGHLSEYQLVQAPGTRNALGKLRFSIPNTNAIYLHDTPVKSLFRKRNRALSHGCIRLEQPQALLKYLLRKNTALNAATIDNLAAQPHPSDFNLPKPMPVYITYHTTWVDDAGVLQLRPDIYHLDHKG
ncbi:L,D-transpeptidase family protein [Shewanella sp. AS16]|uniref:L,D-transpeptidase family protein n=1 Tax=Shewanella sp. AS16 TaxID=2907625 RepID=UPI001F016ED6|nr:L,D-transpeptidase family protein [Shewanella sp. AS16]MCE9685386.1 L,D-transpeptidase family protein [Shewanella sp. AS16]